MSRCSGVLERVIFPLPGQTRAGESEQKFGSVRENGTVKEVLLGLAAVICTFAICGTVSLCRAYALARRHTVETGLSTGVDPILFLTPFKKPLVWFVAFVIFGLTYMYAMRGL